MDIKKLMINEEALFLVTGGAGFIGSNICEKLLENNYRVRVIDNFLTGKEENIKDFYRFKKFEFVKGDIRNSDDCEKVCKKVDYVIHQAALGSVSRSIEDPKTSNDVNITGTLNMLNAAKNNNVKRFVFASSSSVYGDETKLPKVENKIGKPLSPYAITKYANELYCRNFFDLYGLETIGLRYFNVFGKRQDPYSVYAAVIPLFVSALIKNERPEIFGDGKQSRDFTYIDNVVNANILACIADKKACGEVFNIATGGRVELFELYKMISKLLGKNIKPYIKEERKGDIKHSNANIQKANKYLGYRSVIDVCEGLKMSIEWYREYFSKGSMVNGKIFA